MNENVCRDYCEDMLSHFDGGLDKPAEAALMGHLDMCSACRDEYGCLETLRTDLEAIGEGIAVSLPQVDVVTGVMEAIEQAKHARRVVVSFEPATPRRRLGFLGWMGLGAAAAAILVLWLTGYRLTREPTTGPVLRQARTHVQETAPAPPTKPRLAKAPSPKAAPPSKTKFDEIKRLLSEESPLALPGEAVASKGRKEPGLEEITTEEILALRRTAASDPEADARQEARGRLAGWASLTEPQARALADSNDVSVEAKLGAAQVLSPEEAERILLAAVQTSPDDPYLRSELAKAYLAQPDKQAEATDQLIELSELDPENALTQYRIASNLLVQGDLKGATAALDTARSLQSVDTYAAQADASRQRSLEASGMASDAARTLTALTAGMNQYVDLIELAGRLLSQGQRAEDKGNLSSAKDLYESVRVMGTQVADASTLSSERMAGLDIQSSAIDSLFRVLETGNDTAGMQALTQQVNQLADAYTSILQFFDALNSFFSGNVTGNVLQQVSDFILRHGDLNVMDYISSVTSGHAAGASAVPAQ